MTMIHKHLQSNQNIHELGINYVIDLLDRVGFTIHDVNKDPGHHFQLFTAVNDKALLIAVRTAWHPDAGVIDNATRDKLIKESEQRDAVPHFAGISLTSMNRNDIQVDKISKGGEYKVIFNGMTVVR